MSFASAAAVKQLTRQFPRQSARNKRITPGNDKNPSDSSTLHFPNPAVPKCPAAQRESRESASQRLRTNFSEMITGPGATTCQPKAYQMHRPKRNRKLA
jgi:hypothetical protein